MNAWDRGEGESAHTKTAPTAVRTGCLLEIVSHLLIRLQSFTERHERFKIWWPSEASSAPYQKTVYQPLTEHSGSIITTQNKRFRGTM